MRSDIALKRKLIVLCVQMLLDPMGGIVMTNDGNAILREVIMNSDLSTKMSVLYLLNINIMFSLWHSDPGPAPCCQVHD